MGSWGKVNRYWHTLRHLRPVQFYGRVWFRLCWATPDLRPTPPLASLSGNWQNPARRLASITGPGSFLFLNQPGLLAEIGWDGPQREKLWRYNQHYFDDLNAIQAFRRLPWHRALLDDWIVNNPPGTGVGWEPYPLSLRVVNWIKWALDGSELSPRALHSLAVQVRWLTKHLEIHLLGNHLFANAKALMMAGLFFEGIEADKWLAKGLGILAREVPEQLLPDGGHFERSTMYQALALEDMLDLVNATQTFPDRLTLSQQRQVKEWPKRARDLQDWLQIMCHPDGEISFFNDAAFDIAPSLSELNAYSRRLLLCAPLRDPSGLSQLEDSGYLRLVHGPAVALLDVAPVGPDYLPGHAHADTLSFELSVGTQRVLVNSGTSCYGSGAERKRQRGTAAHNTVVVNGQDSSEVWGGFRVARRAYPEALCVDHAGCTTNTYVSCSHDGYTRLPGRPRHHRTWQMDQEGLMITDRIEGSYRTAEARFHFHPAVQVHMCANQTAGIVTLPNGTVIEWQVDKGQALLESSTWHPRFGYSVSNACLVVTLVDCLSTISFRWAKLVT